LDADIWEIEFKSRRTGCYFNCNNVQFEPGTHVIVAAERGEDIGRARWTMPHDHKSKGTPMAIIRIASEFDLEKHKDNAAKERDAVSQCQNLVRKHNLLMKLVDAEFQLDCNKLTFYFTADQRVDFRELVKDLASIYRTRIELRQIGVRDEAKRLGGFGICGLTQCCTQWLWEFDPISTQLAREQNLSLNPQKISGNCGRLLCCLMYERHHYQETLRKFPELGSRYKTSAGDGVVDKINIFTQEMAVKLDSGEEQTVRLREVQRKDRRKSSFFKKVSDKSAEE
jgi:cell fate regulator YaaT (PSP1 superfamily)